MNQKKSFRNDILPLKDKLYRFALRITVNPAEAEDVVQETLIKLWKQKDKWEEIASIEAYAMTMCRHISIDNMRKPNAKVATLEEETRENVDQASKTFEVVAIKDKLKHIKNIIDALPEKQKCCMQLRDFEEKTYKEIAQIMNISEEQVKVNLFRARQAIKDKIKKIEDYGL